MVRKDLRAYFLTVAVLILFFLVVRMIKYGLTQDADTLSRYLWYAYYVPQMFIPPTILLAAFSLENKKGKPLAKTWYLIYLPAVILLLLIFTNDVHEWVFALNFENGFSYEHRTVLYIALAWEINLTNNDNYVGYADKAMGGLLKAAIKDGETVYSDGASYIFRTPRNGYGDVVWGVQLCRYIRLESV